MKKVFLFLCVLLPLLLGAQQKQGQALIDSLLQRLNSPGYSKEDSLRADILNELTYAYYNVDPDKGIQYGKQCLQLATKLKLRTQVASVNTYLGANYYVKADYPNALNSWLAALKQYEELGNKKESAENLLNVGRVYMVQGQAEKTLNYYFQALAIHEVLKDKGEVPHDLGEIGSAYLAENNLTKAMEYYNKALKINREIGDKNNIADNIGNIGLIYFNEGDYEQTLRYLFDALKMNEELGDKSSTLVNIGNIGFCYLTIAKDTTGKIKPSSLIPAGKAANLRKAIEYLNKCLVMCRETGDLDHLQDHSKDLSEAEELSRNYKGALEDYKQFVTVKDSVFNTANNIKITNLETQRAIDLKDKDIQINNEQIQIDKLAVEKKRNERVYYISGIVFLLIVVGYIFKANRTITIEKQKSEELLLNILPAEVANELKEKGSSDAKMFDQVTVLFTDFKGFTQLSEKLSPKELIAEINDCFSAFDHIMQKYGIEKIKTIGDAYMAAGGLPTAHDTHPEDVVNAALEIQQYMIAHKKAKVAAGQLYFEIRIGIHTGPVVAGIVGVKKFAYDIWGDTVNIASRMESSGEVGHVNISSTTYELVKDKFTCTYRGQIDAKGKGQMAMYYVTPS